MYTCACAGISLGYSILLIGIFIHYCGRKYRKRKQIDFAYNGGLLRHKLRVFTSEELRKATNDFNESRQIGERTYQGILSDKTVVSIKKFKQVDSDDEFVNEVIAVSQTNHRNVVRLLGCCLENTMPSFVYEYISKGSLYEHIHNSRMGRSSPFSLYRRMKAAGETAAALAYLHSSISKPVITPQNVSTRNILFDDNYMVKLLVVPGFSLDEVYSSTLVQGTTIGYLDPEYIQSFTLTEKSNVYSFGVVLAELLTSRRAFNCHRPEAERTLANVFATAVEGGTLLEILDDEILSVENIAMAKKVAYLAIRCLRVRGADRPSMKEVAMELEELQLMAKHPGGMLKLSEPPQKTNPLVPPSDAYVVDIRGEVIGGGSSSVITNEEAMVCRSLLEVDYYLT